MAPHVRAKMLKHFSEAELQTICEGLALPPRDVSVRVNTVQCTREELIAELKLEIEAMAAKDGKEYGTVSPHPTIPDCVVIQRKDVAHTPIPPTDLELIISRTCAEAVLRGSHVFVPGVQGCSPWLREGDEVTILCDVDDRINRGATTHVTTTGK
eukprot:CAMPEP_0114112598 /NCGR_PEP_ID=MMETSP0043_2-20121206/2469_1 /TAXON_ID=464988 /ORGANISM="Hemiselmis andersenii, Strain CCMP644" /LENGTH=154 /DNA_ID=CAMNT_0001204701 /DNA_START=85 /DNA_END=546 /DNA_ORIENTATION=+